MDIMTYEEVSEWAQEVFPVGWDTWWPVEDLSIVDGDIGEIERIIQVEPLDTPHEAPVETSPVEEPITVPA